MKRNYKYVRKFMKFMEPQQAQTASRGLWRPFRRQTLRSLQFAQTLRFLQFAHIVHIKFPQKLDFDAILQQFSV